MVLPSGLTFVTPVVRKLGAEVVSPERFGALTWVSPGLTTTRSQSNRAFGFSGLTTNPGSLTVCPAFTVTLAGGGATWPLGTPTVTV